MDWSSSSSSVVLRSNPFTRLAMPMPSWKSSSMKLRPPLSTSPRSRHEPVMSLILVGPVAEAGGVHRVGRGVVRALVVPGVAEAGVHQVHVLQLVAVDLQQLIALDQPVRELGAREDQVVLDAGAQLGHHRRHRVEVGLAHLHAVALLEALEQRRVDVLRPVEVDEIAVDLLLDRLLRVLLRAARAAHPAAREPNGHRQPGAAPQQLSPVQSSSLSTRLTSVSQSTRSPARARRSAGSAPSPAPV